jgi:CheY-like chemotaxis protein
MGGWMSRKGKKRILIVDDDPEIRQTIKTILNSIGYSVTEVDGANAAIAAIEREPPDAILTDIHMAEGDGLGLINTVRDGGVNIPIVAMSGGGGVFGADNLEVARKLGAAAIVDKPFRAAHLAEAIDRVIAGRPAPHRRS